jgi:hypothetical protein
VSLSATGLGHSGGDDRSCDPILVRHDHNAHKFQSGQLTRPADDHCLACHSLRSLRTGLVAIHAAFADSAHIATVRVADVILSGSILDSTAPSRAPPPTDLL